jgi:Protein of unknown function (DUF3040)
MALSMDEQRMLAEIERRLAAEDPGLASRLSSFRRPGPASVFRSPRARIIGSLFTVALVAVISLMVYAMVPFRAHVIRPDSRPQATPPHPALTVPHTKAGSSATASTHASGTTASLGKTGTAKAAASSKPGSRTSRSAGNASAIANSSGVTVRSANSGPAHSP